MTKLMAKVVNTKIKRVLTVAASVILIMAMVLALAPAFGASHVYGGTLDGADRPSLWAIEIGDLEIACLDSKKSAEAVIEGITNYYVSEGTDVVSVAYDQEIKVTELTGEELNRRDTVARAFGRTIGEAVAESISVEEAIQMIVSGVEDFHLYTACEGDTLKSVAKKSDNDADWLYQLNKNLKVDMNDLKGGELIVYKTVSPYVNVTTVEKKTQVKTIEYDVVYKYTSKMDVDESKVITKGKDGERQVITQTTKVNGETTNSETLSNVVLTKAVDKVVLRGTKDVTAKKGKTYRFADGDDVARFAKRYVGNPYRYGGSSLTNGSDCSGFVMAVYDHFGLELTHSATAQRYYGRAVGYKYAKPGDIVIYPGHSAIYIGNGKIVHAMNEYKGICISNARYDTILAIRRVFED